MAVAALTSPMAHHPRREQRRNIGTCRVCHRDEPAGRRQAPARAAGTAPATFLAVLSHLRQPVSRHTPFAARRSYHYGLRLQHNAPNSRLSGAASLLTAAAAPGRPILTRCAPSAPATAVVAGEIGRPHF